MLVAVMVSYIYTKLNNISFFAVSISYKENTLATAYCIGYCATNPSHHITVEDLVEELSLTLAIGPPSYDADRTNRTILEYIANTIETAPLRRQIRCLLPRNPFHPQLASVPVTSIASVKRYNGIIYIYLRNNSQDPYNITLNTYIVVDVTNNTENIKYTIRVIYLLTIIATTIDMILLLYKYEVYSNKTLRAILLLLAYTSLIMTLYTITWVASGLQNTTTVEFMRHATAVMLFATTASIITILLLRLPQIAFGQANDHLKREKDFQLLPIIVFITSIIGIKYLPRLLHVVPIHDVSGLISIVITILIYLPLQLLETRNDNQIEFLLQVLMLICTLNAFIHLAILAMYVGVYEGGWFTFSPNNPLKNVILTIPAIILMLVTYVIEMPLKNYSIKSIKFIREFMLWLAAIAYAILVIWLWIFLERIFSNSQVAVKILVIVLALVAFAIFLPLVRQIENLYNNLRN
ncbi:hypothetical protein [Pyrodictium abyssi]|uniref:hypothetical protein n=1 Tax=Pyrodictium abyssi TaxID=54256 RepID=UPI0030C760E2